MTLKIRPIESWPGELRGRASRKSPPFQSSYTGTLEVLDRELRMLRATVTVVQLAVNEGQVRRDGKLYARVHPDHPGVILSFDTKAGHFRYACDMFSHWHANLRAIALGLEALRKIERYGIGSGTEQYTGFLQLETAPSMTFDDALTLFADWNNESKPLLRQGWWERRAEFYRAASKATHPDTGGSVAAFDRMRTALRIIDKEMS